MSDKKDKNIDYKEDLIKEIPDEFLPKEEKEFDPDNISIRELLELSGFVDTALKVLPKEHREVYLSFVDSLVEKNQKSLDNARKILGKKEITKKVLEAIVAAKRSQ